MADVAAKTCSWYVYTRLLLQRNGSSHLCAASSPVPLLWRAFFATVSCFNSYESHAGDFQGPHLFEGELLKSPFSNDVDEVLKWHLNIIWRQYISEINCRMFIRGYEDVTSLDWWQILNLIIKGIEISRVKAGWWTSSWIKGSCSWRMSESDEEVVKTRSKRTSLRFAISYTWVRENIVTILKSVVADAFLSDALQEALALISGIGILKSPKIWIWLNAEVARGYSSGVKELT